MKINLPIPIAYALFLVTITVFMLGCNGNLKKDLHDLQTRVDDQANSIKQLEAEQASQMAILQAVLGSESATQAAIALLQADQSNTASEVSALQAALLSLQAQESAIQVVINQHTAQLALLSGYKSVVDVVNPCGDTPGIIDEVLLRLSDGTLLASFSDNANGLNTRFSIIPPGSYIDTDGSNCHFTVNTNGSVTW